MTDTVVLINGAMQILAVILIAVPICVGIWYFDRQKRRDPSAPRERRR